MGADARRGEPKVDGIGYGRTRPDTPGPLPRPYRAPTPRITANEDKPSPTQRVRKDLHPQAHEVISRSGVGAPPRGLTMSDSSTRRAATRAARNRQHVTGEPYAEARRRSVAEDDDGPATKQFTAHSSMLGSQFTLVPPLAEEFSVSGTADVVDRARQWALEHQLLLFRGNADACVHGLYRMDSCAAPDACHNARLDHTQIWVQHDGRGAFLLTQPYVTEIPEPMVAYAQAHGLRVASYELDGWYGRSALPIRLSIPNTWPLWPIERDAVVVLHTQPTSWPDPE